MATALLTNSHRRFMMPKILATINSTSQWPYLQAKSCRLFSDAQKNSNLSEVTPTASEIVAACESLPVSYPMTVSPAEKHRVFISFRGDQLRYNFFSHLTDAFDRHQIKFFEDKAEQRGRDLKHIFVRIEESRIGLVIFSNRYPESQWCMSELVKMKERAEEDKLQIIPIFYKVEPSDVRKPTRESEFGRNFFKLTEAFEWRIDPTQEWREALEFICDKMGLCLGEKSSEANFVKKIVKEVERANKDIRLNEEENHSEILNFRNYKTRKR